MKRPDWLAFSKASVWLVCIVGFLYQASDVIELYRTYDFTVTVYEELRRNIQFPGITVCTEKWSQRRVLCENKTADCDRNLTQLGERLIYDLALRERAAFSPDQLFQCRMRFPDDKCPSFNCSPMIRRTMYRNPFFTCFTFDPSQYTEKTDPFHACSAPWFYELELRSVWDPEETGSTDKVHKYPILVHQPGICPPERLSQIYLRPGIRYSLSITQRTFRRLPAPSASKCTDYGKLGVFPAYFGYMNYEDCVMKTELTFCHCVLTDHEYAATAFKNHTCKKIEKENCQSVLSVIDVSSPCKMQCGLPCNEVKYDVKLVGLMDDHAPENMSSVTAVIRFATDSQTVYDYQTKISDIEALGYIGGYIGLWLGVSLYSIYVGLESSLLKFLHKCWNHIHHRLLKRRLPFSSSPRPHGIQHGVAFHSGLSTK